MVRVLRRFTCADCGQEYVAEGPFCPHCSMTKPPDTPAPPSVAAALGDDLRAAGWAVAIHNDYWLNGERKTFWLFTHRNGTWVKGEGATDADALNQCREQSVAITALIAAETERCAKLMEAFPDQILQFWDRPGGPPGNGYRPTTNADRAAAIRRKANDRPA